MSVLQKRIPIAPAIVVMIASVYIVKGIMELSPKAAVNSDRPGRREAVTYRVSFAKEVLSVDNRLWYIIPTGTEHYYFTLSDDETLNPLMVRADKKWFDENFDPEGNALRPITVTGLARECSTQTRSRAKDLNNDLPSNFTSVSATFYADTLYKRFAVIEIVIGALIMTIFATLYITYKLVKNGVIVKGGTKVNLIVIGAIVQGVVLVVISVYLVSMT